MHARTCFLSLPTALDLIHTYQTSIVKRISWEIIDHSPYNLGLVPSDYHVFEHLNKWLNSQQLETDDELQKGINEYRIFSHIMQTIYGKKYYLKLGFALYADA